MLPFEGEPVYSYGRVGAWHKTSCSSFAHSREVFVVAGSRQNGGTAGGLFFRSPPHASRCAILFLVRLFILLACSISVDDFRLRNSEVWTGDPCRPWARSVLIRGNTAPTPTSLNRPRLPGRSTSRAASPSPASTVHISTFAAAPSVSPRSIWTASEPSKPCKPKSPVRQTATT